MKRQSRTGAIRIKTFALSAVVLLLLPNANAQRIQTLQKTGSTEIALDVKVEAFGPSGTSFTTFPSNDKMDSIMRAGYPKLINLPDSLTDLKVYTVISNPMQFYYQNYRNGIYTKQYFMDKFKTNKWLHEDTLMLTSRMIKCYLSYAVGYDRKHNPQFVVDANGNNDFGDDELRPLTQRTFSLNPEIASMNPIPVAVEYYDGKNICIEKVPCLIKMIDMRNANATNIIVGISYPQFKYATIAYEGQNYYVCADMHLTNNAISISPVEPNFEEVKDKNITYPHRIVRIGDAYFKYEPISQNKDKIRLTAGFSEADMNALNIKPPLPAVVSPPRASAK